MTRAHAATGPVTKLISTACSKLVNKLLYRTIIDLLQGEELYRLSCSNKTFFLGLYIILSGTATCKSKCPHHKAGFFTTFKSRFSYGLTCLDSPRWKNGTTE